MRSSSAEPPAIASTALRVRPSMAWLWPLPGGRITQNFGPSVMAVQPAMYFDGRRAWWQDFVSAWYVRNCHAGVDFAGGLPAGTPMPAAEAGTVVRSTYDDINGGGNVVEVEVRPGVRYSYNHCQSRRVKVGDRVTKGQIIATVGTTGLIRQPDGTYVRSSYGVHNHAVLTILQQANNGELRPFLHDFAATLPGGRLADSALIEPIELTLPDTSAGGLLPMRFQAFDPPMQVSINAGVNVRSAPSTAGEPVLTTRVATTPIWLLGATIGATYTVAGRTDKVWYCYWQPDGDTANPWDGRILYFVKPLCRVTKRG